MRLLINAASAYMGGAVTYLTNLLRYLPEAIPNSDFVVYIPKTTQEKLKGLKLRRSVRLYLYPYRNTDGVHRLYFDQVSIPRLIRKHKCDLLFSSTGFGTLQSPVPQVLLVRNAVYFNQDFHKKYKELDRSRAKITIRRLWSMASIRAADLTLFPTAAMRDMVKPYVELCNKRSQVIHYGFDYDSFFRPTATTIEAVSRLQQWRQQGYKILINISSYAIHKNFETVIEALPVLIQDGHRLKFVTTLSRETTGDKREYDCLTQRIQGLGLEETVVQLGHVSYEQLSSIYQASDIFVFPSFTESFGHPMVEAMAAGLPVVAANTGVNTEVCASAGAYHEPFDSQQCAQTLAALLTDPRCYQAMSEEAARRAKDFSWSVYAQALATAIKNL